MKVAKSIVPTYLMDIQGRFNRPDDGRNPAGTPTNPVKKPEDARLETLLINIVGILQVVNLR